MTVAAADPLATLAARFRERADEPCFIGLDDRVHRYGGLWANAASLAAQWQAHGLKRGETVAFVLDNGVAMPCCYLACLIGGFVACPIVPSNHGQTVRKMLELIRPQLVVREAPAIDDAMKAPARFEMARAPSDPFLIMFTSGLTGDPKAMLHAAEGVLGSAFAFAGLTQMHERTRLYHVLPMAYMAGLLNTTLAPLMAGAVIVEGPLFSPANAVDFWRRPLHHDVNTLSITPTIAAALTKLTRSSETIAEVSHGVAQVQCTSAVIPTSVRERFRAKFSLPLQDCYGMTELGGPLTFQRKADAVRGRPVTTPLDEIDIELRGEPKSQLWIRTPHRMLGYIQDDGLADPFDAAGFLDTGDLARLDDGRIEITGRRKDLIIRGGVNVSPTRVETVLGKVAGVDEVVVVGIEHDFWGEIIVACVVAGEGASGDLVQAMQRHAHAELAAHERPDCIELLEAIPRSFIGKIQKDKLRERVRR